MVAVGQRCSYVTLLMLISFLQFLSIVFLLHHCSQLQEEETAYVEVTHTKDFSNDDIPSAQINSHVYCFGESKSDRQCRFQNLCYSKERDEYIFIATNKSLKFGLPHDHEDVPIVDLSSVDDHNALYFRFKEVTSESLLNYKIQHIKGPVLLLKRFNPENLMHVLHDDVIPIFHTLRKFYPINNNIKLVFIDGRDRGPYYELYKLLTKDLLLINDFPNVDFVCFDDVVVGVSKITTWYQYGFREPQGHIVNENYPKTELQYFSDFVLAKVLSNVSYSKPNVDTNSKFILYFSRTFSRRILNEMQLILRVSSYFKMPVYKVSLENDPIFEIIALISKASVVIGVHGAHLALAVFMKQELTLIELFPFAVPSVNYTPYKTVALLKDLRYFAWENRDENNTVTHEDREPNLGGIKHLPVSQQETIRNTKAVPKHLCCHNPIWLFRIYQDTRVDIKSLINLLDS